MTMQGVAAPPTFNPHGGPITHSSIGSKPDSRVHPLFPKLFLTLGFICNSRATFRVIINSGIKHNTYSHGFEPLSHSVSGNERLPASSKLPIIPLYFAPNIFRGFNSRVTFRLLPRCCLPDSQPCRGPFSRNIPTLYSFVTTMEFPKKGCRLHHDALE